MKDVSVLKYEINPRQNRKYPVAWENWFHNQAPLGVEIGCGNGEFLVEWARHQPQWNYVGIELSLASGERIQSRISQYGLSNVRFIRDDARFVLRELFPESSVHQILMNFPDPWPKEKHKERRMINTHFIGTLSGVLVSGGIFELFSDQKWYVNEARENIVTTGLFESSEIAENESRPVSTKYERKWRGLHRRIYQLRVIKRTGVPLQRILEDGDMPHYFVNREINPGDVLTLRGLERSEQTKRFKVKEIFFSPDGKTYLLRTVTVDKEYLQNFFIVVARHELGFIVKVDVGFQPYRTPAVKMAIKAIADLLGENTPERG